MSELSHRAKELLAAYREAGAPSADAHAAGLNRLLAQVARGEAPLPDCDAEPPQLPLTNAAAGGLGAVAGVKLAVVVAVVLGAAVMALPRGSHPGPSVSEPRAQGADPERHDDRAGPVLADAGAPTPEDPTAVEELPAAPTPTASARTAAAKKPRAKAGRAISEPLPRRVAAWPAAPAQAVAGTGPTAHVDGPALLHAAPVQGAPPSVVSAPDVPVPPPPARKEDAPTVGGLSAVDAEMKLMAEAFEALRRGAYPAAWAAVEAHRRDFPTGTLSESREVTRMLVLCGLGRRDDAARVARQFLAARPHSPFAQKVAAGCAQPGP